MFDHLKRQVQYLCAEPANYVLDGRILSNLNYRGYRLKVKFLSNHPISDIMQKNSSYLPCAGCYTEKFCLITQIAC